MRVYAVADIHGKQDRIRRIRSNVLKFRPDVLVLAGDITHFTQPARVIAKLSEMPVPLLAIRGNTDLARVESLMDRHPNISSLHLREIRMAEIPFVGVSGTLPLPFRSQICLREARLIERLEPLVRRDSFLIAHPPPWGILDKVAGRFHAGCQHLRELIFRRRPAVMVCGHIHEQPGLTSLGKTLVINCSMGRAGEGSLIDLDEKGKAKITML